MSAGARVSVSVCVAVFNEGPKAERLLGLILAQSRLPDETVIVDDASTDDTYQRLVAASRAYSGAVKIQILRQERNGGPALARNRAWKSSSGILSVFTDGDCRPARDWLEKLVGALEANASLLAAGGSYSDPEEGNLLSRFIGFEISWRYSRMADEIDCHGSYNLAVRREVLEKLGGFDERYPKPSGEDFDLTYRIAAMKRLAFVRAASVGHDHPDQFWSYLRNQFRRGLDRVRLYLDHPGKASSDSYTDAWVKYEVAGSAALVYLVPFAIIWNEARWIQLGLLAFLAASSLRPLGFLWGKGGMKVAVSGAFIRFVRVFAWMAGLHAGFAQPIMSPLRKQGT